MMEGLLGGVTLVASVFLLTTLLFALYLAYCAVKPAKESGRLKEAAWFVRGWAYAIVYFGLGLDILFNVFIGTLLFVEAPDIRKLTFTARCAKWKTRDPIWQALNHRSSRLNEYRWRLANWFCRQLNVFEPGHC